MNDTGFLFIPEHIMEREDLSLQEKCVYGRIVGLTKKEGYCYITNECLGEKLGLSGERTKKIISKLNKMGVLRVVVERYTKENLPPGETWFTKRKIYVFEMFAPPEGVENDPQVGVENDPYSNTEKSNTFFMQKNSPEEIQKTFEGNLSPEWLQRKKEVRSRKRFPFPGFKGGKNTRIFETKKFTVADGRGIR